MPTDERELDLDLVAPKALAAVLAAIAAVVVGFTREALLRARTALSLAIEPARVWPEGPERARARAALLAKRTEIEAAEAALDATPVTAPAPVASYVIQASPPVPLASMAPVAPVATHDAQWARIRTGTLAGDWGATVNITEGSPKVGDRLRVHRAAGGKPTIKRVASVITTTSRGVLVSIADDTAEAAPVTAPALGSAPVTAPDPAVQAAATALSPAALVEAASNAQALNASDTGTIADALGVIATEGTNIAASAAQGAAAHASRAFVGFRDPAQYLQALRNGGLQAHTRADYIARCHSAGLSFDESTLPPANAPSTGTSTGGGGGIVHAQATPGKNYFQMSAAERKEHDARRKLANETRTELGKIIDAGQLIAGAVAAGGFLQISWVGGGTTTVGKVREAFAAKGLTYDAPTGPSAERHAGRAVDSLKTRGMDTKRLASTDLPSGIAAQWLVGEAFTNSKIKAGDAYGRAALVVSLTDGGDLTFDNGDQQLADACRAHFRNATEHEVLRSEDLTTWYAATLREQHYGVKRAHNWYVPGGEADAARALSEALGSLWGDHETMPVTTGADLKRSLSRGLTDEIGKVQKEYDKALATAQDRAATSAHSEHVADCTERNRRAARRGELALSDAAIEATATAAANVARERARVSAPIAARLLLDLGKVAARVEGFCTVLGGDATNDAVTALRTLRDTLEALCSDGDQRTAMLDLREPTEGGAQ